MKTVAEQEPVTSEGSAPSNEIEISERHADFLPTDKKYRLTGEMPAETEEPAAAAAPAKKAPAAGESDEEEDEGAGDDNAAASEAATTQEGTNGNKPRANENRWHKVTRENRELREKLARAEGRAEGAASRETKQPDPQPATAATKPTEAPKPKIDDVDEKTGKPKYGTLDDFLEARDNWLLDNADKRHAAKTQQSEQQRQQTDAERVVEQEINRRVEEIRKEHPDYDDKVKSVLALKDEHGNDALYFEKKSPIDGFLLQSNLGQKVLYHIANNWDACKAIFARDKSGKYLMSQIRQVSELAKIEAKLESSTASSDNSSAAAETTGTPAKPAKPVSAAPRPAHQTSGKGAVGKDPIVKAVEDGDQDAYNAAENAKALARRKRG